MYMYVLNVYAVRRRNDTDLGEFGELGEFVPPVIKLGKKLKECKKLLVIYLFWSGHRVLIAGDGKICSTCC